MSGTLAIIAFAAALAGTPAPQPEAVASGDNGGAPTAAVAPAPAKASAGNRPVCKREVPLGSRVGKRTVCTTAAELERRRQQDRAALEYLQTRRQNPLPK